MSIGRLAPKYIPLNQGYMTWKLHSRDSIRTVRQCRKLVHIVARKGKRELGRLDEKGTAKTNITWIGEVSVSRGDQDVHAREKLEQVVRVVGRVLSREKSCAR